jgi:hypothetical protein
MITRDNYESFFIDYLDGNLPEGMIDQFLDFLNQNPDLKEELHLFEEVMLPEETIVFGEKKQLHKSLADENRKFENKTVAYLEGDLDVEEHKAFKTYLAAHSELKNEYDLFAQTRLIPDSNIHFPDKQKLYHKSGTTIVLTWVARAAAVVVLVWGINSVINMQNATGPQNQKQEFAAASPKQIQPQKQAEPVKIASATVSKASKQPFEPAEPLTGKDIYKAKTEKQVEKTSVIQEDTNRDTVMLAAIAPIKAPLETSEETQLAFHRSVDVTKINEPNVLTVDEFLAMRAKKMGKEGIFSVQRIARLGLNIASEISGERIGYKEKDGKITSVDFESKLMAFSIPLEKK